MTDTPPQRRRMRTALERFEEKYIPEPNSGCWLWIGGTVPREGMLPRAVFFFQGKTTYAARAAYQMFRGPIPPGMHVCHTCDMPPCVNPDHLFLGTPADNTRDMIKKGRSIAARYPELLCQNGRKSPNTKNAISSKKRARGERHGSAKLTASDVRKIRALSVGGLSNTAIARQYGVDESNVCLIVRRKRWKHV